MRPKGQSALVPTAVTILVIASCSSEAMHDDATESALTGVCNGTSDATIVGTNLVANGTFEASLSGWTSWNGQLSRVQPGHCGSYSARVTSSSSTYTIDDSPPTVGAPAVATYHAQGWVRASSGTVSSQIVLRERSSAGVVGQSRSAFITLTSDWKEIAVERTVMAGATSLEVYVVGSGGGAFLVDDISVVRKGGALDAGVAGDAAPSHDAASIDATALDASPKDAAALDATAVDASQPPPPANGLFKAPEPWTLDVSSFAKDASSDAITTWLKNAGGWGGGSMRIDFSIEVLTKTASTPFVTFTKTSDFYSPDCDYVPFPVPPGGALEGESGYQCTTNGDCHLIVVDEGANKLYEMWRANIATGGAFSGGCAAVWSLTRAYPDNLRGDGCTSADAGGFPIAAMLFSADEVAAGAIDHAVRFILPNARIQHLAYVHPGTHTTGATSGAASAPPYGVRMRLRADYPLANLTPGARVVAKAMQTYGMLLADAGTIALTAQSDTFTQHKWSEVGVSTNSLSALQPTDFEVVDMSAIEGTTDCQRNFSSSTP